MRRTIILRIFFLLLITYLVSRISLSFADYREAQEDYKSALESYRAAYQEYTTSKNTFLTYKTLSAETEALSKTKTLLEKRDDLLITYFTLLKEKLQASEGLPPFEQNLKLNSLDVRISFLQNHKNTISAIASIDDAVQKSKEVDGSGDLIKKEAMQTVGAILSGKVENEENKVSTIVEDLSQIVTSIKKNNTDVSILERWLLETKNKLDLTSQKITEAKIILDKLSDGIKDYSNATRLILEGNQYLKEAVFNAKEALFEIKTGPY